VFINESFCNLFVDNGKILHNSGDMDSVKDQFDQVKKDFVAKAKRIAELEKEVKELKNLNSV